MAEQALDLRSALATWRRWRWLLVAAAVIGIAVGVVFVEVRPPQYSSSAQVLLPAERSGTGGRGVPLDIATEIRVAQSDTVLGSAGEAVQPRLGTDEVAELVVVDSLSDNVLRIVARGDTPAAAESLTQAVAESELAYQESAASSLSNAEREALSNRLDRLQGQLTTVGEEIERTETRLNSANPSSRSAQRDQTALADLTAQQASLVLKINEIEIRRLEGQAGPGARLIQSASQARRPMLAVWYAVSALVFAVVLVGVTALVLASFGRRDRWLRTRDEIADALGSPVLGTACTPPVRNTAGWAALLSGYTPSSVDAWSLRQALDIAGVAEVFASSAPPTRNGKRDTFTLTVVVLSGDRGGLALAAQLAAHTATLGVATKLTPLTRHDMADALWACGSTVPRDEPLKPNLWVDVERRRKRSHADLIIEVAIVERHAPSLPGLRHADALVLAVSSGNARDEDLARTAVTAYEAGGRFQGALVADPDGLDRTTGRLLHAQRATEVVLPAHLTGVETRLPKDFDRRPS